MTNYLQGVYLTIKTATYKDEINKIYQWMQNGKELHRVDRPDRL